MKNLLVVIPAIKKNAVIPDQLIKKLDGITLIQRAINTAKEITSNILIVTDSEEISLIAQRNKVEFYLDAKLTLNSSNIIKIIKNLIKNKLENRIILYRANTPLVNSTILKKAYKTFLLNTNFVLTSVRKLNKQILTYDNEILNPIKNEYFTELKSFYIFDNSHNTTIFKPFIINDEYSIEIESYQDWWICEKVLQRKRIIFNVIGSVKIGMGHIYHSLALAHEISDHEVIFICDEQYELAVQKIASMDYKVISVKDTLKKILELKPHLVVNDILNTDKKYIKTLKKQNIKVVNFEDLGTGSKYADIVFNELYNIPQYTGDNYLWGHEYLALRDEFNDAIPHVFQKQVHAVLISFGGTDQNNLTLVTLKSILNIAKQNNVKIFIVCGSGYLFRKELTEYIKQLKYKKIELTFAIGVISKIMEQTQIAFSSNGRTVYELADMNIPSVVISHHQREHTHDFAKLERGFLNLGIYDTQTTANKIKINFEKLILDTDYRKLLFLNIKKYKFRKNKKKVVNKILELI